MKRGIVIMVCDDAVISEAIDCLARFHPPLVVVAPEEKKVQNDLFKQPIPFPNRRIDFFAEPIIKNADNREWYEKFNKNRGKGKKKRW